MEKFRRRANMWMYIHTETIDLPNIRYYDESNENTLKFLKVFK